MKLKYYLRGIGIGVVVTTIIFMVSMSIHKEESEPKTVTKQNTESQTVAQYESSTQEAVSEQPEKDAETEKATETEKPMEADKNKDAGQKPSEADESKGIETQKPVETDKSRDTENELAKADKNKDKKKKSAKSDKNKDVEQKKPAETDKSENIEKVRIEVGGGEYSDVICEKLQTLGLVDNAEAFNKYLIENNYDNFIQPGAYDIPKDSTYDEIAKLLTTRVSKEKTE